MKEHEAAVDSYTTYPGPVSGATLWRVISGSSEHRVLPDGAMDLMWFEERLVVAGADTRAMTAHVHPGTTTWGLRLPPGFAPALLRTSASELTDQRAELTSLVTLPRKLAEAFHDDVPGALTRVFTWLRTQSRLDREDVRRAALLDTAAREGLSVTVTASMLGMSTRTLRRFSARTLGLAPMALVRIHRLQRALDLAKQGWSLSDAAAATGYADHAHFTRECTSLSGLTPSAIRDAQADRRPIRSSAELDSPQAWRA